MYVMGGRISSSALRTVERFDPLTSQWKTMAPLSSPRGNAPAVLLNGKFLLIGGYGTTFLSTVDQYNPVSSTWSDTTIRMHGLFFLFLCFSPPLVSSKCFVCLSASPSLSCVLPFVLMFLNLFFYSWACFVLGVVAAAMPSALSAHMAMVAQGKVFVIGGSNLTSVSHAVFSFDPESLLWKTEASCTVRTGGCGASLNGLIYVFAGHSQMTDPGVAFFTTSSEVYNPATRAWTPLRSIPSVRRFCSAVVFRNSILVIGGVNATANSDAVELYSPAANEWTKLPPLLSARYSFAAVVLPSCVLVMGGIKPDTTSYYSSVEQYAPDSDSAWSFGTSLNSPARGSLSAIVF